MGSGTPMFFTKTGYKLKSPSDNTFPAKGRIDMGYITLTIKKSKAKGMVVVIPTVLGVGSVGAMWHKWFSMKKKSKRHKHKKRHEDDDKYTSEKTLKSDQTLLSHGDYYQNNAAGGTKRKRKNKSKRKK
jgi:endonuclease IV